MRFLIATLLLLPSLAYADFTGKVVGVTDGDTIKVMHNGREEKVRLQGIDTPEKRQPFGTRAKQLTSHLAFGKTVTVKVTGRDQYGRTIGAVILPDGRNLNHELVKAGFAWWYRKYAPDDRLLEKLEAEARDAKAGLWRDPNPVPPWVFRRIKRGERLDLSELPTVGEQSERGPPAIGAQHITSADHRQPSQQHLTPS